MAAAVAAETGEACETASAAEAGVETWAAPAGSLRESGPQSAVKSSNWAGDVSCVAKKIMRITARFCFPRIIKMPETGLLSAFRICVCVRACFVAGPARACFAKTGVLATTRRPRGTKHPRTWNSSTKQKRNARCAAILALGRRSTARALGTRSAKSSTLKRREREGKGVGDNCCYKGKRGAVRDTDK